MDRQTLSPDTKRLTWLAIAVIAMFACAYSVARWLGLVGTISGWIGLPEHEAELPQLQSQMRFWAVSALILPFVGALLVWAGRQKRFDRSDIGGFVFECGICLAIAILGTLGSLVCLFGLGLLIHKLR